MTAKEIEIAVANWLNYRQNIIVPNVSWGLLPYEADLLSINKSGFATEIEIKVSASDLKRDLDKSHKHESKLIKYLYFAIPEKLLKYRDFIPEKAGILVCHYHVYDHSYNYSPDHYLTKERDAKRNPVARALTQKEISHTAHLGIMRLFNMKKRIYELEKSNKRLTQKIV